jgi:hypothetical protein
MAGPRRRASRGCGGGGASLTLEPDKEVQRMQEKTTLDVLPILPPDAFYSNFFALDQLAQSAPHQQGLFHSGAFG